MQEPSPAARRPSARAIFIQKVPALTQPLGLLRAVATAGLVFGLAYRGMRRLDRRGMAGTVGGQLAAYAVVAQLARRLFSSGPAFRARYSDRAYEQAFLRYVLAVGGIMGASFLHLGRVEGKRVVPLRASLLPGLYLVATGAGLASRLAHTLGVPAAALVNVYFPEEGQRVDWGAYRVVRHPGYAGMTRLLLGIALMRGRARSLVLGLMVMGWFRYLIRVEEAELVQRFGPEYEEYRRTTPALLPDGVEREMRLIHAVLSG